MLKRREYGLRLLLRLMKCRRGMELAEEGDLDDDAIKAGQGLADTHDVVRLSKLVVDARWAPGAPSRNAEEEQFCSDVGLPMPAASPDPPKQNSSKKRREAASSGAGRSAGGAAAAADDGPKKPQSAYFLYAASRRAQLAADRPELGGKAVEMGRALGAEWKELSEEERAGWRGAQEADHARYVQECEAAGIELPTKAKAVPSGAEKKAALVEVRPPAAEEAEVLAALDRLRKAGEDAEEEVHGWSLKVKTRSVREEDGKAKGGVKFDVAVLPPERKPKLTSVVGVKRHMGLVRDAAEEQALGGAASSAADGAAGSTEDGL